MHKLHACIFSISLMFANFQVLANSSLPVIEQHLLPQQYLKGTPRTYSIKQMMEAHKVSGLSLAFIDNGQLLWVKAYGEANLSDRQPVTTSTVFTGAY
ncbi:serine hydrolase [Bowmanella yangjiangensis]|uniref:Serine hydrolase n=1 Tax=Bowmanella yangjiangensis TaxID=2811230 RepID=A0ABS3CTU7_9ALTE|nr:serine hydrolase [Bowmanella yangjiangensis]MBN7820490.1 serine hydrolase [Bowmanella yangjiangensis]